MKDKHVSPEIALRLKKYMYPGPVGKLTAIDLLDALPCGYSLEKGKKGVWVCGKIGALYKVFGCNNPHDAVALAWLRENGEEVTT